MCPEDGHSSPPQDLDHVAWGLYCLVYDQLMDLQPNFLPPPTPDGSQQMALPGTASLPSPGEMGALAACLSWALEYLSTSGKLPSRDQLFSFAKSQGLGPVGYIITPLFLAILASLMSSIASGESDMVMQICADMIPVEAQPVMSPSTFSKTMQDSESGISSTPLGLKNLGGGTAPSTSSPDLEVPGNRTSRGKRKKSRAKKKPESSSDKGVEDKKEKTS